MQAPGRACRIRVLAQGLEDAQAAVIEVAEVAQRRPVAGLVPIDGRIRGSIWYPCAKAPPGPGNNNRPDPPFPLAAVKPDDGTSTCMEAQIVVADATARRLLGYCRPGESLAEVIERMLDLLEASEERGTDQEE